MSPAKIIGRLWLAGTVAVALYFVSKYLQDNNLHIAQILDADPEDIAGATLTYCCYFLTITVTWQLVLTAFSNRRISRSESASQIVLINLGKYIPGKIWGLAARAARLNELEYTPAEISRSSFLEQVLLLLTGLWLSLLAAGVVYESAIPFVLLVITTGAIVAIRNTRSVVDYISNKLPRAARVLRFVDISVEYQTTAKLILGFVLTWLFLIATFMLMSSAFVEVDLDVRSVSVFVLCITSGYLFGFVAIFAPGGIGVREAVGAVALAEIMPIEQALLLMLLFRVWVVVFELAAGLLVVGVKFSSPATDS